VVLVGWLVAQHFIAAAEAPGRQKPKDRGTLVEVETATSATHQVQIQSFGTVTPARHIQLRAQVPGRVVWLHPALIPGGRIQEGELLLRLDSRDYALAVNDQRIALAQAEDHFALEQGRSQVAAREVDLLAASLEDSLGPLAPEQRHLATREPQVRIALANIDAARSRLKKAELDLERARISAPFNAMVQQKNVEIGDILSTQTPFTTLVGTDHFWVTLSIPADQVHWINIPGWNATEGSPVTLRYRAEYSMVERQGTILGLQSDVEPLGRMARVLVEVADPLGPPEGKPLLLGTFVEATLPARDAITGIAIPRDAVRDGDRLFIINDEQRLEARTLTVVWRDKDRLIATDGIAPGERYITTLLAAPTAGMRLRVRGEEGGRGPGAGEKSRDAAPERSPEKRGQRSQP